MIVEVTGVDLTAKLIAKALRGKKRALNKAVRASGNLVLNEIIRSMMQGNKSGAAYQRRTITHVASAAGEAPASDTGDLVGSFVSVVTDNGMSAIVGSAGEQGKKSRWLEFGTSTIKPRPHLIPALESNRRAINELIKRAMK